MKETVYVDSEAAAPPVQSLKDGHSLAHRGEGKK